MHELTFIISFINPTHCCTLTKPKYIAMLVYKPKQNSIQNNTPEMSIGLDLDWSGSGLCRILLNLDWIRTVNCFLNLGSGSDLE